MKSIRKLVLLSVFVLCSSIAARGQALNLGSDGSDGAFVFVPDTPGGLTMTIDLSLAASGLDAQGQPITWQTPSPVAGRGVYDPFAWAVVFKYSSVDVPVSKTVKFRNRAGRPPVVWLAQTSIVVRGTIDVSGERANVPVLTWPEPGPGGFRGAGSGTSVTARAGFGPGGGSNPSSAQYGNFASSPPSSIQGAVCGAPSLYPLIGGSGSNSFTGSSDLIGGPGGGAILLAANQHIDLLAGAVVYAYGGWGSAFSGTGYGSGGAVRLLADTISLPSGQSILATGWSSAAGVGRIRVECNSLVGMVNTNPVASQGLPGPLFPDANTPVVRVATVTLGSTLSVPSDPRSNFTPAQADVTLPAAGTATLTLEAHNVTVGRTCSLRVTTVGGSAMVYTSTPLTGTFALSTATVSVPLDIGIHAVQARVVL